MVNQGQWLGPRLALKLAWSRLVMHLGLRLERH